MLTAIVGSSRSDAGFPSSIRTDPVDSASVRRRRRRCRQAAPGCRYSQWNESQVCMRMTSKTHGNVSTNLKAMRSFSPSKKIRGKTAVGGAASC